jgi:hypothetical protein
MCTAPECLSNSIALDSRLTTVLSRIGVEIDPGYKSSETVYAEEEQRILTTLCKPVGMSGVEFDQLLYQNYEEILDYL